MVTASAERKKPKVWIPLLLVGAVATYVIQAQFNHVDENHVPIIRSGGEMKKAMDRAQDLSTGPLERFHSGEQLTDRDREDLQKAAYLFEGCGIFQPALAQPWIGSGRIYEALIEDDPNSTASFSEENKSPKVLVYKQAALTSLQRALERMPVLAVLNDDGRVNYGEAHFLVGRVLFFSKEYELSLKNFDEAVKAGPNDSDYYYGRGSLLYEMGKKKEAVSDLQKAVQYNPNNTKAASLLRFYIKEDLAKDQVASDGSQPKAADTSPKK